MSLVLKPLPLIAKAVREPACDMCAMSADASGKDVCVTAQGSPSVTPTYAVIGKFPPSQNAAQQLGDYLTEVGLDPTEAVFMGAVKCRTWGTSPTRTIIKTCAPYLKEELALLPDSVQYVLVMGNEALQAALGKSGITKYRSQEYPITVPVEGGGIRELTAIPTIAHTAVSRNPGQLQGFMADMRFFAAKVAGKEQGAADIQPPKRIRYVLNKVELRRLKAALENAAIVSYDIESASEHPGWLEKDPSSKIVSIAFTIMSKDKKISVWALPLFHPESPWRNIWERILEFIREAFCRVPRSIAHNGKFDNRWLRQWGVERYLTFDTMLAAHLLNENRVKGLKPLAHMELGVPNWGIDTKELLKVPIMEVLEYNALDTWYTYFLYRKLRRQLLEQPRLRAIFQRFYMPSANEFTGIERRGVWTDRERLFKRYEEAKQKLAEIDLEIMAYVPDEHPFKTYDRAGNLKDNGINLNPSNFLRWLLFEHLELPVIKRGKEKDDGRPGDPSVAEGVMMELAEIHPIAQLLIDRIEWNKYCSSFFAAYVELIDAEDRIHTTFKLHGTTTGRLSSGKENDGEKISAKKQIRGVNLQQVPRNKFIRGLFGAPPGSYFVEFDYSQVELRVAAELAKEPTMIHLYQTGQDIHMAMAMQMTGKPAHLVTKEERKKAKSVNFGFLYGMQWRKYIETAWNNYGLRVTEEEAQAFRKAFFQQFPELLVWHRRQRALVAKYGRVESPLGRVRHLPDIYSPDREVKAEAERQAINSPVQSFASDMILISLVILHKKFREMGLKARSIGTVHDALNLEIPADEMSTVLPMIKHTMENLPLDEWFNVHMSVPIIADCKVGTHWGDAMELEESQIHNWDPSILTTAA
ncbi:DNA polymerase I [Streptomyces phage Zuko]|uniref:DNA polymerase I n=1 Tax=Streptomyces phage Zuko TaxID=2601695 RepID=A0A5J6D7V8_9CAUD|nr:DNA polymerase I [Streptomyces phage Zuko]QEQ93656.1 DNA polymerase I [Streptomyces phage Zuko]